MLGDQVTNLALAEFFFAALAGIGRGLILDNFNRERQRVRLGCNRNAALNLPRDSSFATLASFSLIQIPASFSTSRAYVTPFLFSSASEGSRPSSPIGSVSAYFPRKKYTVRDRPDLYGGSIPAFVRRYTKTGTA